MARNEYGVEIYREFKEVPPPFSSLAVQDVPSENRVSPIPRRRNTIATPEVASTRNCGLINIWTRKAW